MLFCALALLGAMLACAFHLLLKRDVRLNGLEVRARREEAELRAELKAERAHAVQVDITALISNQHSFAKALLRKMWADLYEAGRTHVALADSKELYLLEDITHLVENSVSHEVLLDLVRNHVAGKSDGELELYSDAKARSYWQFVKTELYKYSAQLPGARLDMIMDYVPESGFKELFMELYSGARHIAGGFRQ